MTETPYYRDDGEGEPLVLLHSGGMAHQEWDVHLEAFGPRYRVIAPDLPGHGRTPLEGEELTVAGMVEALEAVYEDAGIGSAHLVGSSMGGGVALRTAVERPELVDRLVLFRIGFRRRTKDVATELSLDEPAYWERVGMDEWLARVHEPQGGPEAWKQVVHRAAHLPRTDPEAHDLDTDDLETIDSPTLVVAGDRDPIVPVEEAVEMYRSIPDADLWIVPHASHVVAARTWRREAFGEEIVRFLQDARHIPEEGLTPE